jgi:hypothetical protein
MTPTDRRVRHLRLRAGSQADVSRVLPVLEDALRCASLPDTGSRLLLVRRLALGPIARDAGAQALARVIEQRVAAVGGHWVEGGTPAAAGAAYVSFTGALEARVQLALRIARGVPHAEWYWPLAVPELRAADGPGDALRRIAGAIAQWPEARRALPAWGAALVHAGAGAHLAAAIDASHGEALVRHVGLAMPDDAPRPAHRQALPGTGGEAGQDDHPGRDAPRWLCSLLAAAQPLRPVRRMPTPAKAHANEVAAGPALAVPAGEGAAGEICASSPHGMAPSAAAEVPFGQAAEPAAPRSPSQAAHAQAPASPSRQVTAGDLPRQARLHDARQAGPWSEPQAPQADRASPQPSPASLEADPTACAGLLFLLPVLARLGLAQWLAEAHDTGFAQRVLHQALRRLRAPAEDPAWALAAVEAAHGQALDAPAPACWSDPLLAGSPALTGALHAASSAEAQATVWLTATRRWLRRAGRIGLASLVRRPGFVSLTPTHADLHFHLHDTDLRVRRLGLDIDPGWLPWFGRVAAYHYHRGLGRAE